MNLCHKELGEQETPGRIIDALRWIPGTKELIKKLKKHLIYDVKDHQQWESWITEVIQSEVEKRHIPGSLQYKVSNFIFRFC